MDKLVAYELPHVKEGASYGGLVDGAEAGTAFESNHHHEVPPMVGSTEVAYM